jgi:putative membrane protein
VIDPVAVRKWPAANPENKSMNPSSRTLTVLFTTSLLALSLGSQARAADTSMTTFADRTFVHKVGLGGMFEVDAGKMAQEKGSSQAVKDFGANEVKDHTVVNDGLKSVADSMGIAVPEHRDAKFQKMYDSLESKSGTAFDKAYVQAMAKLHDGDEALFVKESKTTKNPDMQAFAAKSAATVEGHIDVLHNIEAKGVN